MSNSDENATSQNGDVVVFSAGKTIDAIYEASIQGLEYMVEDVQVDQSLYLDFILAHHKSFVGMSLNSSVEYMFARAKAEITRQIKSGEKAKENQAAGLLLKEFHLTPQEAKALLAKFAAEKSAEKTPQQQ